MDKKDAWNLRILFENDEDPRIKKENQQRKEEIKKFVEKWKHNQSYTDNSERLKEALEDYKKLHMDITGSDGGGTKGYYYFWLRTQQDSGNPKIKAKFNKAQEEMQKQENDIRFFELSLARVTKEKQNEFLKAESIKIYHHYLERIFSLSPYLLSEEAENILALKQASSYQRWVEMVQEFLSCEEREIMNEKGKKFLGNFEEIITLMKSQNKKARDKAADAFNNIMKKHLNIATAEINNIINNKKIDDELRKLPRPDKIRHLNDDIESDAVDILIQTISKHFKIANRYYKLKAKLLKVKKLKYHERNITYGKINNNYTYAQAKKIVRKVFSQLDNEFAEIFDSFANERRIDVYPHKGKRGGAFCTDNTITQPTYILLNYTNTLGDITTLAHEMGHGINAELMKKRQNALTFGTPTSTAEVASTFMEDFVIQEILKSVDEEERLALLMEKLNNDISSIFRQVACYRFEQELHKLIREKGYLSKEDIGKLFQKHMKAYMGPAIEQSVGSENWWVYWYHIRMFFYVYSYSSGLLISKALQKKVRENPEFIKNVKEFLSAGKSDSPKNIFKNLGIDITQESFWLQGLNEVEHLLKETEMLAKKLGKI